MIILLAFGLSLFTHASPEQTTIATRTHIVLDKPYAAMQGPLIYQPFDLALPKDEDRVWITGFKLELTRDGQPAEEHLCHSRLGVLPRGFKTDGLRIIKNDPDKQTRSLIAISQGRGEVHFPEGFAELVALNAHQQHLMVGLQLQNARPGNPLKPKYVDAKMTIFYRPGREGYQAGLKPLRSARFALPAQGQVHSQHAHGHAGETDHDGMFLVPPGRHVYQVDLDSPVSENKTVHYMRMHLHAYGESIELYDLTDQRPLWLGRATTDKTSGALAHADDYSSVTGFRLAADHRYRLNVVYNNTTNAPVDAMALLAVYYE